MADIEDVVDVNIVIQDAAVSQSNFGLGLIMGQSNRLSSKVQEFSNIEAVQAVYTAGDPELVMATDYFGQEVKPESVVMANRDVDEKLKLNILITVIQDNTDYVITTRLDDGTLITVTHPSGGAATRANIVDGLIALLVADTVLNDLFTYVDNGDDFTIENDTAGDPFTLILSTNLKEQTLVALVNIETELAAIEAINSEWYTLNSDSHLDKDIKRAANFIQARKKTYITSSQNSDIINSETHISTIDFDADFVTANLIDLTIDGIPVTQTPFNIDQSTTLNDLAVNIQAHAEVLLVTATGARQITIESEDKDRLLIYTALLVTAGASQAVGTIETIQDPTTDLGFELKALSLDRTFLLFKLNANAEFPEGGITGLALADDPGVATLFAKTIAGISIDDLTDAQSTKARNNNVNTYEELGGLGFLREGQMMSGRFFDVRRDVDFIEARIEEDVFAFIKNSKKIQYTNDGANSIVEIVDSRLELEPGIIARDPAHTVTVPDVRTEISANDRANRLLPDVKFIATLGGAIHRVRIDGTVSV